jgi:Predicted glycosyltransferases
MPELSIIIVSWNVADLLRDCIESIHRSLASSGIEYDIHVVDSASSDGTPAMLRQSFPEVVLYESPTNIGFAGGNNLALCALGFGQGPNSKPAVPFVMLLNPDTRVESDAIPQLLNYLKAHPELVAVGPQLRYGDGTLQSSRRRFPTSASFFWESTPLERLWPDNPWKRHYHYAERSPDQEQRVGWLVGAALLVRSSAIVRAGLLDEGFFMYSEELEWQYRLQLTNTPTTELTNFEQIGYLPSAVITHYEGRSSEQILARRHINFQLSKIRLARLLKGPFVSACLRRFLIACYLWELAVETAKLLIGHRRDLRRQRVAIYSEVLRSLNDERNFEEKASG